MEKICIADDDRDIVNAISLYCQAEGFKVYKAYDGLQAIEVIQNNPIDLLIIDQMMPHMSGLEALSLIREKYNLPVIILSAKSENLDKIQGLDGGADDYVTKPFVPMELIARIKSQLRRYNQLNDKNFNQQQLMVKNIRLDKETKEVFVNNEKVKLTPMEFDILQLLMENKNKVFSSQQIYESIMKMDGFQSSSTISVHIRHIREKIEVNPNNPQTLKVIWGVGYKLEE